jgi:hypothetical protein
MLRTLVFLLLLALTGCGAAMTPAEIGANGTKTYEAPREKVMAAIQSALKAEGYGIATVNEEKGIIKTERKLVRAQAQRVGASAAIAQEITRQYIVRVSEDGDGKVKVVVEPKVFQGDADLSDGSVWQLDGAAGERTLWKRLFQEISDNL